jgi:hypothetical protein
MDDSFVGVMHGNSQKTLTASVKAEHVDKSVGIEAFIDIW